jgi:protoporphyrinogen IX oxidase
MIGFLGGAYPWVVAAHIIFVIFWMAGLFMLPRFFVYHQEAEAGSAEAGRWIEREARLIRIILNPAMIIVWLLGLTLATDTGAYTQIWFHLKLLSVVGLSAYHGWMCAYAKRLAIGDAAIEGKTLRLLNEVPGIAVTVIVILVIIRPFA